MSKAEDSSQVQELASELIDSYSDVAISVPKSDRDRSRTVRRARKRLRAARRMESRTQKQRVERHTPVPENRPKLLY